MSVTVTNAAHRDRAQADACRRLWAAVILGAYYDWWREAAKARTNSDPAKAQAKLDAIRADALRYFSSSNGRFVAALAGIIAVPERLADAAVDPDGRARTGIAGPKGGEVDA